MLSAIVALVVIWSTVLTAGDKSDELVVAFLDIGQGDSIFIQSPSGEQMLIDGGRDGKVLRELAKVMPFYDHHIDVVLATHPDADHIGGLINVLKRYDVDYIFRPGVQSDTPATESLLKLIAGDKAKEVLARRGMVIDLGAGVFVEILFPDRDASSFDTNIASIVVRLTYGETSFLLTGDAPIAIEKYLVSLDGHRLHSNVLKLGHHGSKTSSSDLFLGFVDPEYAVISAGKDNGYGHPNNEVLDRLERFNIKTLSTITHGTTIFKTDGTTLRVN